MKARVRRAWPLLVVLLPYALWAQFYIERTSFESRGEQVFCLWDDAMISMRYAHNFARGEGLVWNPGGERVQGFSNPAVTLAMTGIHLLPLPPSKTSLAVQWLALALLLGIGVASWVLSRRLTPQAPVVAGAALLATTLCSPLAVWTLQGSDVGFVALWLVACSAGFARDNDRKSGWPVALLAVLVLGLLIRWDSALFFGVFLAIAWLDPQRGRHRIVIAAACGALALGSLLVASWLYYGDPLPNTFYLKATGTPLGLRVESAIAKLALWGPGLPALVALAGLGVWWRRRDRIAQRCAALLVAAFAYDLYVGGDWAGAYGSRFLVQALPLLFVLAAAGLHDALQRLDRRGRMGALAGPALLCAMAVVGLAASPREARNDWFDTHTETMYRHYNVENYLYARYFREYTRPGTTLGLHSAGVLSYFSEHPGIDVLGRSDRRIARMKVDRFEPGHAKWDWDYVVNEARPDIIVFASRGLALRSDFRENYVFMSGPPLPHWPRRLRREFYLRKDSVDALRDDGVERQAFEPTGEAPSS